MAGAGIGVLAVIASLFFSESKNFLISAISNSKDKCQTTSATTFIKSYRLKDTADAYGITETKDGGYVLTGQTLNPSEMKGPGMFWIKADKNGNNEWSKMFDNGNSEGYAITQLTDGNYLAAGQVVDFRTDAEQEQLEGQGDNFVVKIDNTGKDLWTRTVSQQSIDTAHKLAPTSDGGFIMSGSTGVLIGHSDVADIEQTQFLGNFDSDGNTNWLKKIESGENMTKSVEQTKDGGYILIGNIKLVKENDQKVPALVKLKKDGTHEWATGLENLPIEIPNLIMNPDGKTFKVGTPNKMHLAFGDFISAEQTNDGGYIALGRYFPATSAAELAKLKENAFKESNFVAVKVDSKGKLKWARVLKVQKYLEDPTIEKTKDGGFIIMGNNLVGGYVNDANIKQSATYQKLLDDYYAKYPPTSPETPESKKALTELSDKISSWQSGLMTTNIVLIKTDANFKYQWGKIVGGAKNLLGYSIIPTADSGLVIAGTWHTGIKYKLLGSWMEYTEAMILKLDANGNLGNDNGLITDLNDTETAEVSQYVVANKLSSPKLVEEYPMDNVVRTIKVSNKKGTTTTSSEATTYDVQSCSTPSKKDSTTTAIVAKTRPEMKYDETKEVEATSTKGKIINNELMPVLKNIFKDVKLWDDFAGNWVAYRFKRLVTKDDIGKLVTAMTNLGYKIDSNSNGDFTATKIGATLNFHFYLGDTNTGHLDVTY